MVCLFPFVPCIKPAKTASRKALAFPRHITVGSVTTTIYKVSHPTNRNGFAFTVIYYTPKGRKQQKFADMNEALQEARVIAGRLAAGRVEGSELSRGERDEYVHAKRISGDHPLLAALEEWSRARALCGADILAAAQAWKDAHGKGRKDISIPALVTAFLRDRERAGVDTKAGYARTLPRLADSYPDRLVHTLTAQELKEWLHATFRQEGKKHVHPSTFNSHRKRMATLWKWARDEGYLPKNSQTEVEQIKTIKEESLPIGILKIAEYAAILKLVQKNEPSFLATAVLAGFAGLRRCEVGHQKWADIDLKRGLLTVTKAKRNTPAMRHVHLCPTTIDWLMSCKREGDMISPRLLGLDDVRKFAREAKIPCPDNAFRHSYITYRVAATGNIDETSLEAGTSREKIFKHYRELVGKDEGQEWFALTRKAVERAGQIVAMGKVAV